MCYSHLWARTLSADPKKRLYSIYMTEVANIWGEWEFELGEVELISIGKLRLWILLKDADIWIGHKYADSEEENITDPPNDLEWRRWAIKTEVRKLKLQPVFPDKPLVVKSEYSLKISPGAKIDIFARIPIWICIRIPSSNYQLTEIPIVKLSRTWFGDHIEGELCYHATTKARRSLSKIDPKPYLVNCPITISNKSEDDLDFENFCYRVERLRMFQKENELWADETQIIYHGESLNSDVIMSGKLPDGISKDTLITEPRKKIQKSLATRTFKRFF